MRQSSVGRQILLWCLVAFIGVVLMGAFVLALGDGRESAADTAEIVTAGEPTRRPCEFTMARFWSDNSAEAFDDGEDWSSPEVFWAGRGQFSAGNAMFTDLCAGLPSDVWDSQVVPLVEEYELGGTADYWGRVLTTAYELGVTYNVDSNVCHWRAQFEEGFSDLPQLEGCL